MKQKIGLLYTYIVRMTFFILPDIPIIMRIRGWFYSFLMSECGTNFQVSSSANIIGIQRISCGNNVYLARNSSLISRNKIVLEDEVMIGLNSIVIDSNHGFSNCSYRFKRGRTAPIFIRKGSWISGNCVISAGADVGEGSVIGACSSVNFKIQPLSIVYNSSLNIKSRE